MGFTIWLCSCVGLDYADGSRLPGQNDVLLTSYSSTRDSESRTENRSPNLKNCEVVSHESTIEVNGRLFAIEEINKGIQDIFNCQLYLYSNDFTSNYIYHNSELLLHNDVEYELYYDPYLNDWPDPIYCPIKVYIVITNFMHPLSTVETPLLYWFGIGINEWGLQSYFYYQGREPEGNPVIMYGNELIHLGSYTMRFEEIVVPPFEKMGDEWVEKTKYEIRMYMDLVSKCPDTNDLTDRILASGNYQIYVKKFFRSDADSVIIFVHEDGHVYTGIYYYVHENTGLHPANLNHVELEDLCDIESFMKYLDIVQSDPAVSLSYFVS